MSKSTASQIRDFILDIFDEDDFDFFCYGYFPQVHAHFDEAMPLRKKAQLLIMHCDQLNLFDELLAALKAEDPAKFDQLSLPDPQLETPPPAEPDSPPPAPDSSPAEPATPPQAPQEQDVFISYSTKNLDFVTTLYQQLTSRGISTWFDKQSIDGATQWREEIVKGIMGCKVFLLVLSPTSAESVNVRKEIDLAEHHKKTIFPVMWQPVNPLPPSIQYQLAGTQYIDLKQTASEENFSKIAGVLNRLLGGASVAQAATGETTIQAPGATTRVQPGTTQQVSPVGTGINVMTKVVTNIYAFTSEKQDEINAELAWLFAAADHFLNVKHGQAAPLAQVPVAIPATATQLPGANNAVLSSLDDFSRTLISGQIESTIKQIDIYLRNLAFELEKAARRGGEPDIGLMNSIRLQQKSIAERTIELARLAQKVYGVTITAPAAIASQLA